MSPVTVPFERQETPAEVTDCLGERSVWAQAGTLFFQDRSVVIGVGTLFLVEVSVVAVVVVNEGVGKSK